jgi:hypothetical protein
MKKLFVLLACLGIVGCSSYDGGQGSAGSMEQGSVGSEGSSRESIGPSLREAGEDTEHNATRRDLGGAVGGSGGTSPGGAVGPR